MIPVIAPADVPVALLPVGLETRFSGDTLLIRVLPDEIHVEDHEPELTEGEVQAGRTFWSQVWRGGTEEPVATEAEREAWARLVSALGGSRRAAWVAEQNEPIGGVRPVAPVADSDELPDPPVFPEPPRRPSEWSRPATARALPDRFVAIAYRRLGTGGQVIWQELARASGQSVADEIQLGFDPSAPPPPVNDDGPQLPDGMRWLVDVDAAERAGLLIRLPLPPGTNRVDRLIVVGVLGSLDAAASAERLAELLVGHRHGTGLELLSIGTPTNNTATERSGFATSDDPSTTFAVERRTPPPPDGSDGALLAGALGVAPETFRGVAHSGDTEQMAAGQMNALLWPSSLGYWLDSLIQPGPKDADIADLREHVVQLLRGRGPLPPLRVGRQPYGVLPVTSLRRWLPSSEPPAVARTAALLRAALPWWLDGVGQAPVVRAGERPDQGTLDMLGQAAVSSTVGVRSMVGANLCFIPSILLVDGDGAPAQEAQRQRWLALVGLRALGVAGLPYLGRLVAGPDPVPMLRLPYTIDPRVAAPDAAGQWAAIVAYLNGLRGKRTRDLQAEDPRAFTALLPLLARRSVMLERVRAGISDTRGPIAGTLVEAHLRLDHEPVLQAQLLTTSATMRIGDTRSAASAVLGGSVQRSGGQQVAMPDHLDAELVTGAPDPERRAFYLETLAAAEAVAALAPDRAALLLGEALDVASHRFDAWVTSLATRRLWDQRSAAPAGVTLGAYGTVEDIVRRAPRPVAAERPDGFSGSLLEDVGGGGYVHAPSPAQAATAAVLRSGHLAHAARDPNGAALAIDLSSSRVRLALGLLDGVREGQSLGALLGYRAERLLHERGAHTAVAVLRELAPPPVLTEAGSSEGLQARAVCDGLALARMDRVTVLAAVAAADRAVVSDVLDALDDGVDAVADLLLAESVHQIVRGNPDRAAGALDTLNRGEGATAMPDVVATPRTGTTIIQRAAVLLAADVPTAPGWPTDGVRARAEPRLAAWAGHLLGDPTELSVMLHHGAGVTSIPFAELGLGALDVVYEPLAARVHRHARRLGVPAGASVDLGAARLGALLSTADSLRQLLTRSRIGTGFDLTRPHDVGGVVRGPPPLGGAGSDASAFTTTLPDVDGGNRRARLDAVRARLAAALDALAGISPDGPAPAEAGLLEPLDELAGFGLAPGGEPAESPTAAELLALRTEGLARLAAATAAPDDAGALFGEGFSVLPLSAPPNPEVLAEGLAIDPVAVAPADVLEPFGGIAGALVSWIEVHGRVRPKIGLLADALLAWRLRATSGPARLRAVQQPVMPFPEAPDGRRGQWVGLPFPDDLGADPVTSIVASVLGDLDPARGIAVLVIDEFAELVPGEETTTGVAFGYDSPGARPPQSVLLAVPPVLGQPWTVDGLAEVVGETLDLAKIRMVDLSSVAWAGRFVPTTYLTDGDLAGGLDLPMRDLVRIADARAKAVIDP